MTAASHAGFQVEPNVTPMIDVLLVMLIVFMVAVVRVHRTMDTQLPQPCFGSCGTPLRIVLDVLPGPRYLVNQREVAPGELLMHLRAVYAHRPEKIIEVSGDPRARYDEVVGAMDVARSAGATVIAIAPKRSR